MGSLQVPEEAWGDLRRGVQDLGPSYCGMIQERALEMAPAWPLEKALGQGRDRDVGSLPWGGPEWTWVSSS